MQTSRENLCPIDSQEPVCSICSLHPYKYKCPACGIRTCCIECVKKHKLEYACSGKIDPTKYIPMNEIKDLDKTEVLDDKDGGKQYVGNIVVQRDYNFLLNLSRHIDLKKSDAFQSAKPLFQKRRLPNNNGNNRFKRPRSELYHNIFKKGTVSILQMPLGMQRAKQNKTYFDKKSQKYLWSLEFIFYISGSVNYSNGISIILSRIPETDTLENVLKKINGKAPMDRNGLNKIDPKNAQPLELLNLENCKYFFLKKIYTPNTENPETPASANNQLLAMKDDSRKVQEDIKQRTIMEILNNQLVLEFPTIYVSDCEQIPNYNIVDNIFKEHPRHSDMKMKYGCSQNSYLEQDSAPELIDSKKLILEDNNQLVTKNNTNIDVINNSNATLSIAYNSDDDDLEDDGNDRLPPLECSALHT